MTDHIPKTENTKAPDTRDLCAFMGLALASWQRVEDCHYLLFERLLGNGPSQQVCSILYFSPPSFESRRVLVDRMAQVILTGANLKTWTKLNKDLGTESAKRGKLAHYGLNYEIIYNTPEPSLDFKLGAARLVPSSYNQIAELLGNKTAKSPLTVREVSDFIGSFIALERRLEDFIDVVRIELRQPEGLAQGLSPYFSSLGESPQTLPNSSHPDKPPSDQ